MNPSGVPVPVELLLDSTLSASAKILWICLSSSPPPLRALLGARSGLSRNTITRALDQLHAAGWTPSQPDPTRGPGPSPAHTARLPGELLSARSLSATAKLLYAILQLTHRPGQTTHTELAALSTLNLNTVKRALSDLHREGWLDLAQQSQRAPPPSPCSTPPSSSRQTG